jgi:hypothetical protein
MFRRTHLQLIDRSLRPSRLAFLALILSALVLAERLSAWVLPANAAVQSSSRNKGESQETTLRKNAAEQELVQALAALNTPWRELLNALKSSHLEGIVLDGFEPSAAQQRAMIRGQAPNSVQLRNYMSSLQATRFFTAAHLTKQVQEGLTPPGPMQFVIQVYWGPQ